MENDQAVYLWNNLCYSSFGGEWGGDSRMEPMGFTAHGAGLPTNLHPQRKRPVLSEDDERKRVARWLREWADALVEGL